MNALIFFLKGENMEEAMRELINTIKEGLSTGIYDWLMLIVPTLLAIINVWIVNSNTNKQIRNQNKETYRPRLKLLSVNRLPCGYSNHHKYYAHSLYYTDNDSKASMTLKIELENIGNGLANDLQFYMLNSGEKCIGYQWNESNKNQVLDSTEEIPKDNKKEIIFDFNFNRNKLKKQADGFEGDDCVLLICNYRDLNKNNYKILIGIILKKVDWNENYDIDGKEHVEKMIFDYYYYQEDTKQFKGMINKKLYKKNYKRILKNIFKN